MKYNKEFDSEEHKKAWLLRVSSNLCRDLLRYSSRHRTENIEDLNETAFEPEKTGILEALNSLPENIRIVMLLHYVHEYKVREIADILRITQSTAKMRLKKGRELLENIYRKEFLS